MAKSEDNLSMGDTLRGYDADVAAGYWHYCRGAFDSASTRRVFWSNDGERIVASDGGETVLSHSRNKGREYKRSKSDVIMLEDFEGKDGVLSLDACKMLDPDALFATTSYGYVRAIKDVDEVVVSARGSYPTSVFREIEIHEIMNNPEIKNITLISRDLPPGGQTLPKIEAYHYMRDEWLERHRSEYLAALATKGNDLLLTQARHTLASELGEAKRNSEKKYVFSKGNPLYERMDTRYKASDQAKELVRLSRCDDLLKTDAELKRLFEEYGSKGSVLTKKQEVIEHFKRKEDFILEQDRIISEAQKQIDMGGAGEGVAFYTMIKERAQANLTSIMEREGLTEDMLVRIKEYREKDVKVKAAALVLQTLRKSRKAHKLRASTDRSKPMSAVLTTSRERTL